VKEHSSAFLEKARSFLAKAQDLLDMHHWPDEAGRVAYLAGLHGAQALIFERTGNIIRRHRGVQRELGRLTKVSTTNCMLFLGRTYDLKAIADYETGASSEVSVEQAQQAAATARRFIDVVAAVLEEPESQISQ
jgi:uncharacterized protein (UPF0332 family)